MDAVEKTEKQNGSRQQGDTLNEIVEKAVKKAFAEMRAEEKRERQKRAFHETKKLMESYTECNAYGNQFTMDELKNRDTGLCASDIIMEFMLIDLNVGQEVSAKVDKLQKNFTSGK